ncbi:MAG TPA: aromatic ring-hydroxylating dioxygenase subunit alpha [Emcibacteraceae bacterium]|nr:aromatic ring-hydroxylating dioxygenase subunit alpha [Emcibacteraceae bacterium]
MGADKSICDLIKNYKPGYSLEQNFYKNPELYERELEKIFFQNWFLAGHTSQIQNAGDYFLLDFANESIIITRNKEGKVKAHLNVCRHRGSRICLEKNGNAKSFTCPYHAWSYDLDGNLIAARIMADDFEKSENGLHKVHVELVGGLIFISLAEKPLSLNAMKDDLKDVFKQFGFDNMKLAMQKSYPVKSNWKLAVENYQECYHCAPSHKDFAKIHAMAQSPEKFNRQKEALRENPPSIVRTKASSFYFDLAIPGEEGYQYDRNPLLPGKLSGSKDGKPVAPLLGDLKKYDGAASEFLVGPVTFFLIYDDHMIGYRFLPTTIDDCICDLFWFVRADAVEGKDYNQGDLSWLWHVTILDDEEIIVNNQKGVNSKYYKPGRLSEMEHFPQHFLNWYLQAIS